ncbi:MAG: N-6 DNA methylase [archaeon]|nr:N-6 DNA methylase [archaeon]
MTNKKPIKTKKTSVENEKEVGNSNSIKMVNERKNEAKKDIMLYNFIKDNKKYKNSWDIKKIDNKIIQEILDKTSKRKTGNRGEPDLIYINENKKLLILLENKDSISDHKSNEENKPEKYAVDGVKHYLSFFTRESQLNFSKQIQRYFVGWSFIGIAVSGDITDEYNHLISTFIIQDDKIKDIETKEILDEEDYISFFENLDLEKITKNISESSNKINNLLRSLDSQKRPILLSALMICLFEPINNTTRNDFKDNYITWSPKTIITNIPTTIEIILKNEGIPLEKIKILKNELTFIDTDSDINETEILKEILRELQQNVIPLFNKKSSYDIIGKFYEEFLRYAGITNVKKGIVLTPHHITNLFIELIDIKNNDVVFDPACGTGAFLISAMNKIIDEIEKSDIRNKKETIKKIKENQLIGFDKHPTMYSLAISNMLFRGDGKSKIFNIDFFVKGDEILRNLKREGISPTIGFINPPYAGKDNKKSPTKKEIQFLEKMLDNVSRFGIMIAPLSTYFKDSSIRNRILSKHTLKYVINMPGDLFQPNAATHTAIAVFETNKPHNNKEVILYDLKDDGLILSKSRGRTDALNKWAGIKKQLLKELKNPEEYEDKIKLVKTKISKDDEWIIQAHSKTDYNKLDDKKFINSIKDYVVFLTKRKLDLLDKDIDEITMLEILNENKISAESLLEEKEDDKHN